MASASYVMALHARLSAVIARERSLRPKQSPIRQGDGFALLAMKGAGREMASQTRLSAVIARERSLRPKQSPIRQGDGFALLLIT